MATSSVLARARDWYGKFERPISSLSLVSGFVFDALTLKRVDLFWENLWVVAHLGVVALCILWINLIENEGGAELNPRKIHFWLVNIMQFFFGGLLSTYLVFYFRSATLEVTWPFLLILAAAFVANESLKRHYARLTFQILLLFLCILSFAIFIIPVIVREIGPGVFVLSGIASLATIAFFLFILKLFARERFARSSRWILLSILGVFAAVNALYFAHLIPPLPLSLKDAGIFHSLIANSPGNYTVTYEDGGLWQFFDPYPDIHIADADTLYAYTAIFSPAAFSVDIIDEWQWYDPQTHAWTTKSRIALSVLGGRDGGYHTYSLKSNFVPGHWRVNVLTADGQVVGRLRFNVVTGTAKPMLTAAVKS